MKKKQLASGVMMLALMGFSAERSYAQEVVFDQGQDVVVAEQSQEEFFDQGQDVVITEQEQMVVEQKGNHPLAGGCKPSHPLRDGGCDYLNLFEKEQEKRGCRKQENFTPTVKPGECWSQCIFEGKPGKIYKPVDTCIDCKKVVQEGTKQVKRKEVVKIVKPGMKRTCIEKSKVLYEDSVVWSMKTVMVPNCQSKPYKPECKLVERPVQVKYEVPSVSGDTIWHKVPYEYNWEDLYRRPVPCPSNRKGTDCSSVCNETKTRTTRVGIEKCVDTVTQKIETVIRKHHVLVCTPPDDPLGPCPMQPVTLRKAHIKQVPKTVTVRECRDRMIPGWVSTGHVKFTVPNYKVLDAPRTQGCVEVPTQVCKPILVWRQEFMCLNDGRNHSGIIIQVQEALARTGFDAGPADGVLNDKTKQAILEFQKAKGLAQGGALTKETVEALGISQ